MSEDGTLHDKPAAERGGTEAESPYATLADELFRERVLRARRTPPEEKFLAGEELFAFACSITLAGIRSQFPGASEAECLRILKERLALREKLEDAEVIRPD